MAKLKVLIILYVHTYVCRFQSFGYSPATLQHTLYTYLRTLSSGDESKPTNA